jgi:hypothetical protein
MMQMPVPTAPLAGVPSGLQSQGVWAGRRQLFVRFAGEAETATMYRADALAREISRNLSRSSYHSISISGRDAVASADFLVATFEQVTSPLPVMLDTDGRRADSIGSLAKLVTLVQVTMDLASPGATAPGAEDSAMATLGAAAAAGREHALVLLARDDTSDAHLLRIVEQAHAASAGTMLVVHPVTTGDRPMLDRRWSALAEQATAKHPDVRVALRLPGPAGMR